MTSAEFVSEVKSFLYDVAQSEVIILLLLQLFLYTCFRSHMTNI